MYRRVLTCLLCTFLVTLLYNANTAYAADATLSSYAEGSTITLLENGNATTFLVAKHDYEPGLNGYGRTLLVRTSSYGSMANSTGTTLDFSGTGVYTRLNSTYLDRFSDDVIEAIGTTKYYYNTSSSTTSFKNVVRSTSSAVFLLSDAELVSTASSGDGTLLPTAATLKGRTSYQWTRTLVSVNSGKGHFRTRGSSGGGTTMDLSTYPYYPAFTLPSNAIISDDGTVTVPKVFSVTVPTTLQVATSASGTSTATVLTITNNSSDAVTVTSITPVGVGDWVIVPYDTNMAYVKVDSKVVGLQLGTGSITITKGSTGSIPYAVKFPALSSSHRDTPILTLTFVIEWAVP